MGPWLPSCAIPTPRPCPRATGTLLNDLAGLASKAAISGRSIYDLRARVPASIPLLIDNHGLEGLGRTSDAAEVSRRICRRWLKQIETSEGLQPGIEIEKKGFSMTLHYRLARAKREARRDLLERAADLEPARRVIASKCVVNLLPAGAPQ